MNTQNTPPTSSAANAHDGQTAADNNAPTVAFPRPTPAQVGERAAALDAATLNIASMVNQITHGDCAKVLRQLPDACANMVLTDPPYLVRYKDRAGRTVANDDNTRWMFPAFSELYRVLKPDSYCVCFYGWSKADRFLSVWRECGFYPVGHFVWAKRYASCVRHSRMMHEQAYLLAKGNPLPPKHPPADVQPWKYTGNRLHPTQKPVDSLTPLIEAYSRPFDLVVDPFAGSASTGVAALSCRRRCLLIEKDAGYYQAAKARLDRLPHHMTAFFLNRQPTKAAPVLQTPKA